ncbi:MULTISPECIES: XdhC family protein [unclassified Ensifer]|uniref:XdhC family protein n=1 Tax=unclassified Ensifer TaxID=2633371 RepID=UPI000813A9E6|nr:MULTISPECIES: XdhC family protein [unclassified Ensifer]OCP03903.1 XdhC/CoxF family protein [Ensifer sp. LC11]OCP04343.1 XdhC/CoxF family protein [Ensifer sp. LC13]OCP08500.1 XdhC/CoxF family protein [Ensifer sp. LC14]OCP30416.1 XdhC/CoxF family protein [Ensifer sp. LC499]
MEQAILGTLNRARAARRAAVTFSDLADGGTQIFLEGDDCPAPWRLAVARALQSGKAGFVETEHGSFFCNVYLPPPRILVIGAVHISQALAQLAPVAGFDMTIIDPRTAFATPERFGGVELIAEWPEDALKLRPLDRFTALAAVTHDPKIDDAPIRAALAADCFYVGALGSRKTHAARVDRFRRAGVADAEIARIRAPIGLDIGAASPAEIAVATLAEIIEALRRRDVGPAEGGAP